MGLLLRHATGIQIKWKHRTENIWQNLRLGHGSIRTAQCIKTYTGKRRSPAVPVTHLFRSLDIPVDRDSVPTSRDLKSSCQRRLLDPVKAPLNVVEHHVKPWSGKKKYATSTSQARSSTTYLPRLPWKRGLTMCFPNRRPATSECGPPRMCLHTRHRSDGNCDCFHKRKLEN